MAEKTREAALKALWAERDPAHVDPNAVVLQARNDMLSWQFEAQLNACVEAFIMLLNSATSEQPELAAQFKGRRVYVSRARFPAPAEGEYYWVDLVGCQVSNLEGRVLGTVNQVVDQ